MSGKYLIMAASTFKAIIFSAPKNLEKLAQKNCLCSFLFSSLLHTRLHSVLQQMDMSVLQKEIHKSRKHPKERKHASVM